MIEQADSVEVSDAAIGRLRQSSHLVKRKHWLCFNTDGRTMTESPIQAGENRGITWAQASASFGQLASLAKIRAAMNDQQWENSFTCANENAGFWFYAMIEPEYCAENVDDDSGGVFWEHRDLGDNSLTPEFVRGFADGALAVFAVALPQL